MSFAGDPWMRWMLFDPGCSRWVRCVSLLPILLLAAGCGVSKSKVSGRVLYRGAPLPGGRLLFRPADPKQNAVNAEIDPNGNYQAVLPVGPVKVSVDNRELEPMSARGGGIPLDLPLSAEAKKALRGKAEPAAPPAGGDNASSKLTGKYIAIPDRYSDADKSGLDFNVERGDMKHDIELSP